MTELFGLMNQNLPTEQMIAFCIRIAVAGVCGAAIGYERSLRFKESGIRTHSIVALSAALMMVISKYAFADLGLGENMFPGTRGADTARIAAQVVSGISFLGAGVIFKAGKSIHGLTTAAVIWATAGIGMAIGAGMYLIGFFVTTLVLLMMVVLHRFAVGGDAFMSCRLHITVHNGLDFQKQLDEILLTVNATALEKGVVKEDGALNYDLLIKIPAKTDSFQTLIRFLSESECVKAFNASHERD